MLIISKDCNSRSTYLLAFGIILAALVTVGNLIIGLLYDQRYIAATWMMPILCCGMWFSLLAIAFSDLPLYIVNLYGLWQEKLFCFAQDVQTTIFYIVVLSLFLSIRYSLGFGLPIHQLL